MTSTSKTLIFFGNEVLATGVESRAVVLKSLIEAGYEVAFLVVSQKESSRQNANDLTVVKLAQEHGIEVKFADKLVDLESEIKASGASFGVLAAFGKIVPQSTINLFEHGIINIHPSLLPEFRGPTPIESAMLSDQTKTGVSLMLLSAGMDEGKVYGFSEVKITANISKQSLFEELSETGAVMLVELLPKILDGSLEALDQDHEQATYSNKISKQNGEIDWSKPAQQIEREIRAYLGWPGSYTQLVGKDVTITEAKVTEASGEAGKPFKLSKSSFGVYCGQQALEVLKIKPAGKSEMSSAAFLAGNKID